MTKINLIPYIEDTKHNLWNAIEKLSNWSLEFDDFKNHIKNETYKKFALLLGWDQIRWSLSPFMHSYSSFLNNEMFLYVLFEMTKENKSLKEVLDFISQNDEILWANVTMPYKIDVYKLLNDLWSLDESAKLVWAVNTIAKNKDWNLMWYNTDMYGVYTPIKQKLSENNLQKIKKGYVLWAWWASRAAVAALLKLWINEVTVFNRWTEKMINLANHFNSNSVKKIVWNDYSVKIANYDMWYDEKSDLWEYIEKNSILINTLPFWFKSHLSKYPIRESQFKDVLNKISLYFDVVYDLNYPETPMTSYIKQNFPEIKVCDWIEMVVWQAKKWFEMWTSWQEFDEEKIINILKNKK